MRRDPPELEPQTSQHQPCDVHRGQGHVSREIQRNEALASWGLLCRDPRNKVVDGEKPSTTMLVRRREPIANGQLLLIDFAPFHDLGLGLDKLCPQLISQGRQLIGTFGDLLDLRMSIRQLFAKPIHFTALTL
jgi:hypothetical protein